MKRKCNSQFIYDSVVDESLERIEFYREKKDNNIFDDFYHSHLNCMQELLEQCKEDMKMKYVVIFAPKGHRNKDGSYSPVYVTVCKKPHWESEGIMLQGGLYDATKFDQYSDDIDLILKYCRACFPDKQFCVVDVDKRILGTNPREVWEDVKGDFAETKMLKDMYLNDDIEMRKFAEKRKADYEEKLKEAEAQFHNSRRIFAIFDGKLNWCPDSGLSHHEWLVDRSIVCDMVFQDLVRGYEDDEGIYFYTGDFETSEYVEDVAKSWMNSISETKPVYCGLEKGKVGDKWKPIKAIRL